MKKLAIFGIVVLVMVMGLALAPAAAINANGDEDNDMLRVAKWLDCWVERTGDDDGIIDLGEKWDFGIVIEVTNNSTDIIHGVVDYFTLCLACLGCQGR